MSILGMAPHSPIGAPDLRKKRRPLSSRSMTKSTSGYCTRSLFRARADLEIDGVAAGAVDQTVRDAAAGLETGGVARLEHDLAVVLMQHQLAFEQVDEFILVLVSMTQRRSRVRLDARDIDAELRKPRGIADAPLLPAGDNAREFLWV
jgi:stage V sporulation protein SpoVS